MQNRRSLSHFDHEGGTAARQIVGCSDPAEQPVNDPHHRDFRGQRQPRLRKHDEQRVLAQERGLSSHIWAGQ